MCFIIFLFIIQISTINASGTEKAKIGNQYFSTLEEAIEVANSTDIVELTGNVTLNDTLKINKTVNINLNNFDIKAKEKVFTVQGGSLNLSGKGMIYETDPNYGAIEIKGSDDPTKKDYSTISIGKDVTLEGWSGIFINHNNNTGYGILVNMNGKINAIDDINGGSGVGIYVNGNIQHEDNTPIINLSDTVSISSSGNGIYAAGYAIYNINGAYISGKESGLGIKSGVFNIKNGTIIGSGEDKTPTSGNNNGINASGTAIQIESNPGYKGNIELNIEKGLFKSKNSNVIYEYTVNNAPTQVKSINILGGTYESESGKNVFSLSDSFINTHQEFIYGGKYSSNPTIYLKSGYGVSKDQNDLYEVISSTIGVFKQIENNNPVIPIIIIIALATLGFIIYFNRKKILNLMQ